MEPANDFDTESRAEEHLVKALNYQRMGMLPSAEYELNLARQLNPAIVADPRYQGFHAQEAAQQATVAAWRLPMRVGAGLLVADIVITILLWALNLAGGSSGGFLIWGLVHVGVDLYLVINLLRLSDSARRVTIWWATLGLVVAALAAFSAGSWVDLVMQAGFSGSLLILLAGKPATWRVALAIVVFVLGYPGVFCGAVVLAMLGASG